MGEDVRVVAPGAGELVGDKPDRRVEILSDHHAVHATWSRFGPGREGADLHVHREHTDCFFVLEGELEVRLGPDGGPHPLSQGQLVMVPPLVVHGFANTSVAEVRYLNFHIPGRGFADFMRSIRDGEPRPYDQFDPPADGGRDPGAASVGPPRAPFSLTELEADEALAPASGSLRSIYVIEGELSLGRLPEASAPAGSWVQIESPPAAEVTASRASKLLILDAPDAG